MFSLDPVTNKAYGKKYPNHIEDVDVNTRRNMVLKQPPANQLAIEIKCMLLSAQNQKREFSPVKFVGARPQSSNESAPDFNDQFMRILIRHPSVILLSTFFDGLTNEANFIRTITWIIYMVKPTLYRWWTSITLVKHYEVKWFFVLKLSN